MPSPAQPIAACLEKNDTEKCANVALRTFGGDRID
jgi:hypothetical protein